VFPTWPKRHHTLPYWSLMMYRLCTVYTVQCTMGQSWELPPTRLYSRLRLTWSRMLSVHHQLACCSLHHQLACCSLHHQLAWCTIIRQVWPISYSCITVCAHLKCSVYTTHSSTIDFLDNTHTWHSAANVINQSTIGYREAIHLDEGS